MMIARERTNEWAKTLYRDFKMLIEYFFLFALFTDFTEFHIEFSISNLKKKKKSYVVLFLFSF